MHSTFSLKKFYYIFFFGNIIHKALKICVFWKPITFYNIAVPAPAITATATKMEVVSAEVNSLLPEEIMDTGITLVEDDSIEAVIVSSPMGESIPMETELEEIVNISSTSDSSATVTTESVPAPSSHSGDAALTSTAPSADVNAAVKPAFPGGLHKLGAQTPVTISANQIILNKATDIKIGSQNIKPEGQKLIVTTLGKSGQPIVLALPHSQLPQSQKAVSQAQGGDSKVQGQQIKVVIGGRSEVKPVVGVSALTQGSQLINSAAQPSVLQSQQVKTVQVKWVMLMKHLKPVLLLQLLSVSCTDWHTVAFSLCIYSLY